jgi:hypothetical protein
LYTVADVAGERTDAGHRYLATHEPY